MISYYITLYYNRKQKQRTQKVIRQEKHVNIMKSNDTSETVLPSILKGDDNNKKHELKYHHANCTRAISSKDCRTRCD